MEFEVTIQGITDYIDLILNQEKELTKRPDRYEKMCFRGHSDKIDINFIIKMGKNILILKRINIYQDKFGGTK